MKRKITLSIDSELYEELDNLPRKVSVSEIVNWILKIAVEELKRGRDLSSEDIRKFIERTPEGREYLDRFNEHITPKLQKIIDEVDEIKKGLGFKRKKK